MPFFLRIARQKNLCFSDGLAIWKNQSGSNPANSEQRENSHTLKAA
jgi:hypothetical protein